MTDPPSGSIDWNALEEAPGALQKPRGKRDRAKGRTAPGSTLRTYATLPKVNKKRAAETRAKNFDVQAEACYQLPCYACGREGASVPHHDPSQKNGGEDRDSMPLCDLTRMHGAPGCHQRVHNEGCDTFWARIGSTPELAKQHTREQAGITCYG